MTRILLGEKKRNTDIYKYMSSKIGQIFVISMQTDKLIIVQYDSLHMCFLSCGKKGRNSTCGRCYLPTFPLCRHQCPTSNNHHMPFIAQGLSQGSGARSAPYLTGCKSRGIHDSKNSPKEQLTGVDVYMSQCPCPRLESF